MTRYGVAFALLCVWAIVVGIAAAAVGVIAGAGGSFFVVWLGAFFAGGYCGRRVWQ